MWDSGYEDQDYCCQEFLEQWHFGRHNGIIGESILKITKEMDCASSISLSWAVSAKISVQNFHGFSPNQLAFSRNPNFPCVLQDKSTAS